MADKGFADIELGLHVRDAGSYVVELRYSHPDSEGDIRSGGDEPALAQFDMAVLREKELNLTAYGKALTEMLFASPELRIDFAKARAAAAALDVPLRLRLFIGPSAPELHALRWELLRDPEVDGPLLNEQLLFSRYLTSRDWRPIKLRARTSLRALVVVANPSDLSTYRLSPVDVAGEITRARISLGIAEGAAGDPSQPDHAGLDPIVCTDLASGGSATLTNISQHLRDGYDIFYLVCHGTLVGGDSVIWLEESDGKSARVSGEEFVVSLRGLAERPRLIVLASCQSAGEGEPTSVDGGPLAALGPRLSEAGIPAVIAMQGKVSMETIASFMPVFFAEIRRDGQIDRAMVAARAAVLKRNDYWMPVLFMRLRNGRIWYTPGFGETFERWPALIGNITDGFCTPILGSQINEGLLGTTREMAQSWADTYNFPMAPHQREDLAQVAQFLTVKQDGFFPYREFSSYLRRELIERYGKQLTAPFDKKSLEELFSDVARLRREQGAHDPFETLAKMPFPVFVTAGTDNMLGEALRAAGKQPEIEICRWNEELITLPSLFEDEPDYAPTPERPLIFHLFGINSVPQSLVLTEDDYFDYLIGASLNKDLIPPLVRDALVDRALLFLGFRLDDWSFRVLFRSIMSHKGGERRKGYANIAGQVMPEEGSFLEPERARAYLESYFGNEKINIFWGSVADFTQELDRQWTQAAHAPPPPKKRRAFY